jgi:hypothetical protein
MDTRSGFPEAAQKVSVLLGKQTTREPQNLGGPENQQDVKASNFGPEICQDFWVFFVWKTSVLHAYVVNLCY